MRNVIKYKSSRANKLFNIRVKRTHRSYLTNISRYYLLQDKQRSFFYQRAILKHHLTYLSYLGLLNKLLIRCNGSSYLQDILKALKPEHVCYIAAPDNLVFFDYFKDLLLNPKVLAKILINLFILLYFPRLLSIVKTDKFVSSRVKFILKFKNKKIFIHKLTNKNLLINNFKKLVPMFKFVDKRFHKRRKVLLLGLVNNTKI